ncbi:HNH endonuclease family protein [Mangrovicoccus sp. HB161399]|uniref:HNH endonuclease family protein n=1 Tax=Mangrovicoccus sp. HB161399 TaxID=2720392 RepID=UPI00155456E4|nr:HNH endonuclease family protein [Mangrovicoccus sp. HB161399]
MDRLLVLVFLGLSFCGLPPDEVPDYDRAKFSSWVDTDGDCQATRSEMLISQSTRAVALTATGCSVEAGKWTDPYSGKSFTSARDLQIDHLVPLKWAWEHGAAAWSGARRDSFALDPRNLLIVSGSLNASKGAKDPLDWMPPDRSYHCSYLRGFSGVVAAYRLEVSEAWSREMARATAQACSGEGNA